MIRPSYQDWLQSRPVDWQRFKHEEYYAEMMEEHYAEDVKFWNEIDNN